MRFAFLSGLMNVASLVPSEDEQQAASPASSFLSDALNAEPAPKRRRVSYSSLSSASSSSGEEEERPLATRRAEKGAPARQQKSKKVGRKGGKGKSSMKSKAQTAPVALPPPTDQERAAMERPAGNGINGHDVKVKVEDKMDEGQLTRLVTGVPVDAGGAPTSAAVRSSHQVN